MAPNEIFRSVALLALPWVMGWAAFVLILNHQKNKKRQKALELIHEERMAAIEKGVPVAEWPDYDLNGKSEWLGSLRDGSSRNAGSGRGAGALLVMIGAGFCLAFSLIKEADVRNVWPLGLIFIFAGIGLFLKRILK